MRETFPVKLLLQLLQAAPEQLLAIERILYGGKAESRKAGALGEDVRKRG
jgi:hypothetical protein